MPEKLFPWVTAVVLGAGTSSRMGKANKLTMNFRGVPMLVHVLNQIVLTSVPEVIVVLGYQRHKLQPWLPEDPKIRTVTNEKFRSGMSSSLKKGSAAVSEKADGIMVCLGDMPYLTRNDYQAILNQFNDSFHPKLIVQPTFREKRGHPVCFALNYLSDLSQMPDDDRGAKRILQKNQTHIQSVEMPNDHILLDIDEI